MIFCYFMSNWAKAKSKNDESFIILIMYNETKQKKKKCQKSAEKWFKNLPFVGVSEGSKPKP